MSVYTLAIYAVIFLLLWFVMIRPASKRNREMRQDQAALAVGTPVMLTSGIFGTVSSIDEDAAKIGVEIAPGVTVQIARVAIASVIKKADEVPAEHPTEAIDEAAEDH